jgi:hypothetical protein
MSPDLDEALCNAHPELFALRHDAKRAAPICWGFECGDGWYGLISSLCELISWPHAQTKRKYEELRQAVGSVKYEGGPVTTEEEVERARKAMQATARALPRVKQVKEKFGTLRVHLRPADKHVLALLSFAEYHSRRVCEKCGAPGELRTDGWLRTLCDAHEAERST